MKTLSLTEVKELMRGSKKEPFVYVPHKFTQNNLVGKMVCASCGLIAANNKFSQWAVGKGCNNQDHSGYQNARTRFTKLF